MVSSSPAPPTAGAPLRRAEHHALMACLQAAPRTGRLSWSGLRIPGALQGGLQPGLLQFRPSPDAQPGIALPAEGEAADVLFRIRGVSFRCDGAIQRVDPRDGTLSIKPAVVEWAVRGFRIGGTSYAREPSEAWLRIPAGSTARLHLLTIAEGEVHLLGWPVSRDVTIGCDYDAGLLIGDLRVAALRFEITAAQAVFAGGGGRILRAMITSGQKRLAQLVQSFSQAPERRAEVG